VDVTANGDVLVNGLKIKPRPQGEAPRELEILEKAPPEIPNLYSRANLYVYRRLGMVVSARVGTDPECSLFLEPEGSADLPNVKFSGTLRFRGKEFRISQNEAPRKADFEGLQTKEESGWPEKQQLCFHLAPPSSMLLYFQENGVLSQVYISLLPKRGRVTILDL
jgi:hypothetical protein